jgi:uncharacterized tellurite resistance protein B-like protein
MKNNEFRSLLFRTAVFAMACDGDIADSEIQLIKDLIKKDINFLGLDFENLLSNSVEEIKLNGKTLVNSFLNDLSDIQFNDSQKLKVIEICLLIINADTNIEENELIFLHLVIDRLKIDQETLIVEFPNNIDQLLSFKNIGVNKEFTNDIIFKN